jgi:hypothetical protein
MATLNNTKVSTKLAKWEQVYEDEETITIWRYNSNITTSGPVEVEIKYKRGYVPPKPEIKKTLGDLAKEAQKEIRLKTAKSRVNKGS